MQKLSKTLAKQNNFQIKSNDLKEPKIDENIKNKILNINDVSILHIMLKLQKKKYILFARI